jgi:hypothetical protein
MGRWTLATTEVGALASDPVDFFLVDQGVGQDKIRGREILLLLEFRLDLDIDPFERIEKRKITVSGQGVQALDHAKGVKHRAGGHGSHVTHSKDQLSLELLFDIGDDIQIVFVGSEQVFERGILQSENLVEILFGGLGFRGQPLPEYVYYFQHLPLTSNGILGKFSRKIK